MRVCRCDCVFDVCLRLILLRSLMVCWLHTLSILFFCLSDSIGHVVIRRRGGRLSFAVIGRFSRTIIALVAAEPKAHCKCRNVERLKCRNVEYPSAHSMRSVHHHQIISIGFEHKLTHGLSSIALEDRVRRIGNCRKIC